MAEQCEQVTRLNEQRGNASIGSGTSSVLILGDSYAQGQYLADPVDQAWSTLVAEPMDWTVTVDAVGGTGLVNEGPCGDQNFVQRAAQGRSDVDILVVQTGLNDPADDRLATNLAATIAEVDAATVIVIGPALAPARDAEAVQKVSNALRDAAVDAGAEFIDTTGWDGLTFLDDGVHLAPVGHERYAERVAFVLAG